MTRSAELRRTTKETAIEVAVRLDESDQAEITTGIPFFDHMLEQIGRHGGIALSVRCRGDLAVDTHHSVEDIGIALGQAVAQALGDKAGVRRFASISLPLDEALVDVALDLSGRPYLHYDVPLPADASPLGAPGFEPQLAEEFWRAFVINAGVTLHIDLRRGRNTHHILECTFKAVARALRDAIAVVGSGIPSTKGSLIG
jgi:imidazoleglycerol-phosphate dehydratase